MREILARLEAGLERTRELDASMPTAEAESVAGADGRANLPTLDGRAPPMTSSEDSALLRVPGRLASSPATWLPPARHVSQPVQAHTPPLRGLGLPHDAGAHPRLPPVQPVTTYHQGDASWWTPRGRPVQHLAPSGMRPSASSPNLRAAAAMSAQTTWTSTPLLPPPPTAFTDRAVIFSASRASLHRASLSQHSPAHGPTRTRPRAPSTSPTAATHGTSHVRTQMESRRASVGWSAGKEDTSLDGLMSMGRHNSGAWPIRSSSSSPMLLQLAPIASPPDGPRTLPPIALHPRRSSDPPPPEAHPVSRSQRNPRPLDTLDVWSGRAEDPGHLFASNAAHRRDPPRGLGLTVDTRGLAEPGTSPPSTGDNDNDREADMSSSWEDSYSRGSSLGKRSADGEWGEAARVSRPAAQAARVAREAEGVAEAAIGLKRFKLEPHGASGMHDWS